MRPEKQKISRRNFVKLSTLGTIGLNAGILGLSGCSIAIAEPKELAPFAPVVSEIRSELSIAHSSQAVSGDGRINQALVQQMFDQAMFSFTKTDSVEAAWDKIIPGLKGNDTIGLKINCINPSLPTHPEVVNAIINHLLKLGIKANNILVWDRDDSIITGVGSLRKSGYRLYSGDKGVRYVTTDTDNIGYDSRQTVNVSSVDIDFPVSKIITRECKYLINVPVLKSHDNAGITQCMKNYYGVIPLMDTLSMFSARKMHKNYSNPAIAELYNNAVFKEKTKLHVCDSLFGLYTGGPFGSPHGIMGKLLVGTDPVALDYTSLVMIENVRKKRGIESWLQRSKYIQSAAEMGIGTNNANQIKVNHVSV